MPIENSWLVLFVIKMWWSWILLLSRTWNSRSRGKLTRWSRQIWVIATFLGTCQQLFVLHTREGLTSFENHQHDFSGFAGNMSGKIFAFHTTMRNSLMTMPHLRNLASATILRFLVLWLITFMDEPVSCLGVWSIYRPICVKDLCG